MPLYCNVNKEGFRIGIWKIEESIPELLACFPCPSYHEKMIRNFSSIRRKKEWLAVRLLLASLCKEEKRVIYAPSGRPYLDDASFHISISHTQGYAAVALHPSKGVGIDIEQDGEKVKIVRRRFMTDMEELNISRGDEKIYLLLYWSAKETVYKMMGDVKAELKRHILVSSFIPQEKGTFTARECRTEHGRVYAIHYLVCPDFVLTCSLEDYSLNSLEKSPFL